MDLWPDFSGHLFSVRSVSRQAILPGREKYCSTPAGSIFGARVMTWVLDRVGRHIAAYLQRPAPGYEPFTPADPTALQALIKPGDILLIEGRTHIAGVIKYLTQ